MNVPNSLTTLRILLIPVFIGFLVYDRYDYALAVLLLAGITDGLDGTIARVANQRTKLGTYLDPLADKLLLTSGFITLSALHLIPLWIAILVVSRDLILMTGALLISLTESSLDISPTLLGKGTTLFQLFYIVLVVVLTSRQNGSPAYPAAAIFDGWANGDVRISVSLPRLQPSECGRGVTSVEPIAVRTLHPFRGQNLTTYASSTRLRPCAVSVSSGKHWKSWLDDRLRQPKRYTLQPIEITILVHSCRIPCHGLKQEKILITIINPQRRMDL